MDYLLLQGTKSFPIHANFAIDKMYIPLLFHPIALQPNVANGASLKLILIKRSFPPSHLLKPQSTYSSAA
jgi:hypothetical protein